MATKLEQKLYKYIVDVLVGVELPTCYKEQGIRLLEEVAPQMVKIFSSGSNRYSINHTQYDDIMISLNRDKRVEAIVKFRKLTDSSLLDAKNIVEEIEKTEFPERAKK
jgi:ribosomal protein L7/L12